MLQSRRGASHPLYVSSFYVWQGFIRGVTQDLEALPLDKAAASQLQLAVRLLPARRLGSGHQAVSLLLFWLAKIGALCHHFKIAAPPAKEID